MSFFNFFRRKKDEPKKTPNEIKNEPVKVEKTQITPIIPLTEKQREKMEERTAKRQETELKRRREREERKEVRRTTRENEKKKVKADRKMKKIEEKKEKAELDYRIIKRCLWSENPNQINHCIYNWNQNYEFIASRLKNDVPRLVELLNNKKIN